LPFLEAIRQFRQEIGRDNGLFIHLTLVPYIKAAGEMKTKPSQQSVAVLREIGITPDILICRCEQPMDDDHIEKLSLFCNVEKAHVIAEQDVKNSIYEVPIELARQNLDKYVLEQLKLPVNTLDLTDWNEMLENAVTPKNGVVKIGVVGKYISLRDAYKSVYEALNHAGIANSVKVSIKMIESEDIEKKNEAGFLSDVDGILVPGGFGSRGIPGMIEAIKYAREEKIPFLGICLGMHCAVIEFARNVCNMTDAHGAEFSTTTKYPVIDLMEDQKLVTAKGGTMRLGSYPCILREDTFSRKAYGVQEISERHRHRYEFNTKFLKTFTDNGFVIAGTSPDKKLVEIVELRDHPWFVACQYHPEFKSTPLKAHPLFKDFIIAAVKKRDKK
jgi:CTP synthase